VLPPKKDVTEVVDGCQEGLASLPDTDVTILALGDTAAADARPTRDQLTWLGSLWSTLCGRIATGTCSVATSAVDERIDNPAPPDAAVDDRIVWPVVEWEQAGGIVRVSLPDRLLFDTDSDELRPDATAALESVAGRVRAVSGTIVEVVGHTDGRGEVEYNDLLSLGRAQRVADALRVNFGLDAPARGAGEREPKCSPETRPDGSPDPVALQCNRRVEVVIRLGAPS
jgi:outer membrane protein OmpA-like peptidoglycan-associated protein